MEIEKQPNTKKRKSFARFIGCRIERHISRRSKRCTVLSSRVKRDGSEIAPCHIILVIHVAVHTHTQQRHKIKEAPVPDRFCTRCRERVIIFHNLNTTINRKKPKQTGTPA